MLTSEAVVLFLAAKTAKGLSPRTLETYRYRLSIFSMVSDELPTRPQDIEAFLARTGPTQETRESYYRLIRNLYRWLHRRKFIKRYPITQVEAPILRPKVARALTTEQLSRLLHHPGHPDSVRAFLYLLADTGLRLSEALSVRSADQFSDRVVTIAGGKTGQRTVPVSPMVSEMVLRELPWPWASRHSAGLAVRLAFKRAVITGRRASAHTLRHTFCRLWAGDESLLVGILGWTTHRMLKVYRPYNISRAVVQHREYSPVHLARNGARQLSLL